MERICECYKQSPHVSLWFRSILFIVVFLSIVCYVLIVMFWSCFLWSVARLPKASMGIFVFHTNLHQKHKGLDYPYEPGLDQPTAKNRIEFVHMILFFWSNRFTHNDLLIGFFILPFGVGSHRWTFSRQKIHRYRVTTKATILWNSFSKDPQNSEAKSSFIIRMS